MLPCSLGIGLLDIRTANKLVPILIIIVQALPGHHCDVPLDALTAFLPSFLEPFASSLVTSTVAPILDPIVQPIFSVFSPLAAELITSQPWPPDYGPVALGTGV